MWNRAFLRSLAERALMTFAQALVAVWGVGQFDVLHADWANALSVAGGAALLSVLKTIAVGFGSDGNPSFGSYEVIAAPGATADPVGQETQQTVVPDPTGEIAQQVQDQVAAEDEVSKAEAEQILQQELPTAQDADVAPAPLAPSNDGPLS